MTQQEKLFINSIKNKISKYDIPVTLKECLENSQNRFIETKYNTGEKELVDIGIEYFLCKKSAAYFIEQYCYITIPGKGKEPAKLYFFQREILKTIGKYKKVVYQKSRQTGLSTINSLYCLWKAVFFSKETVLIISKDAKSSQDFLSKIKDNLDTLPLFITIEVTTNNVKSLTFSNGSNIYAFARSKTAGRGTSPSLVVLDEAAFFSTDTIIQGIVASVQASLAKTGGQLVCISTPNGSTPGSEGYWYYSQVKQLEESGGISSDETSKLFSIDWWTVPDDPVIFPHKGYNDKLKEYESKDYFNNRDVYLEARKFFSPIETNWKQNDWLRYQYQTLGDVLYRQEILRDFVIMGNSVFSNEIMEKVKLKIKEPITKNLINRRPLKDFWVWKEPEPKKRYILGCLPAGEKVMTQNGLKDIEKVSLDDQLYSNSGELINIINKQVYNVEEDLYEIDIQGILRKTKFTGEHPIMASKHIITRKHGEPRKLLKDFKFSKVSNLKDGDWLIYPNVYKKEKTTKEQMLSEWNKYKSGRYDFDLKEDIVLDEEFWWFIGIWLAEGWTRNKGYIHEIQTCHNLLKEIKYAERVKALFAKYNRSVIFRIKKESNCIETKFSCNQLSKFIDCNFGKYAQHKHIPEWVKFMPEKYKKKLIEGYLNGDGSIYTVKVKNKSKYRTSFVSISKKLLEDVQDILFSFGIISTLKILRSEGVASFKRGDKIKTYKTKETYELDCANAFSIGLMNILKIEYNKKIENIFRRSICLNHFSDDKNFIYLKINKIKTIPFKGKVYNFETENHTYLCNYLTTHNCDPSSGTSADFSAIQVIDVENYEQVAEYVGKCTVQDLACHLKNIGRYYNNAYVVVECNSIGEAVFSNLWYSDDPYSNLFKQEKTRNGVTRFTGWITDVKTRQLITNNLVDFFYVDELFDTIKIYSERLVGQMSTWINTERGFDHIRGSHDDALIAIALALYNRSKAVTTGAAFIIDEKGRTVNYESSSNRPVEENKGFDYVTSDQKDKFDKIEEELYAKTGLDVNQYKWLIG